MHHAQMPRMDNLFLNLYIRRSHLVEDSLNEVLTYVHAEIEVNYSFYNSLHLHGVNMY